MCLGWHKGLLHSWIWHLGLGVMQPDLAQGCHSSANTLDCTHGLAPCPNPFWIRLVDWYHMQDSAHTQALCLSSGPPCWMGWTPLGLISSLPPLMWLPSVVLPTAGDSKQMINCCHRIWYSLYSPHSLFQRSTTCIEKSLMQRVSALRTWTIRMCFDMLMKRHFVCTFQMNVKNLKIVC